MLAEAAEAERARAAAAQAELARLKAERLQADERARAAEAEREAAIAEAAAAKCAQAVEAEKARAAEAKLARAVEVERARAAQAGHAHAAEAERTHVAQQPLCSSNAIAHLGVQLDGLKPLGEGGFGTVRAAALKYLHTGSSTSKQAAFRRECVLACSLQHEHIILGIGAIFGAGRAGQPMGWLAMEQCDHSLHEHVRKAKSVPPQIARGVAAGIARGLAYLHDRNPPVVHCDLKPANVLMRRQDDGSFVAKIADFGLARELPPGETPPKARGGTPGWRAPEQAANAACAPRLLNSFSALTTSLSMCGRLDAF